jgi:hypothetical protein
LQKTPAQTGKDYFLFGVITMPEQNQATPAEPTYFTVKQFAQKEPAFSESSLRAIIFNEQKNGLAKSGAVIRAGRKVLLHGVKFPQWLESQGGAA